MELIDKAAVVAEIKRRIDEYNIPIDRLGSNNIRLHECKDILSFLDTLKTKEVDLEKEYEEFVVDDPIFGNFITNDTMGMKLAKHFFELGLKAQKGK